MSDLAINGDIVKEFEDLTSYPLTSYFLAFDNFLKGDYKNITGYYSGNVGSLNNSSFTNLDILTEETKKIFDIFSLNKSRLVNYKWWLLVEQLEKNDTFLLMLSVAPKWLRSTVTNSNFSPNPEVEIPFNQGQTLESIERDRIGNSDWQNSWVNLALKNNLREEDYTPEGGFLIKANFDFIASDFRINAIVDSPIGDRVLGLDLANKLEYDTTEQDLVVLSPQDTFKQNATNILNLRKGDNPEFFDQGINPALVVGSNINSISYPILFRQLSALFKADDTIKSFTINKIDRTGDAVFIEYSIQSRLGDLQNISLQV